MVSHNIRMTGPWKIISRNSGSRRHRAKTFYSSRRNASFNADLNSPLARRYIYFSFLYDGATNGKVLAERRKTPWNGWRQCVTELQASKTLIVGCKKLVPSPEFQRFYPGLNHRCEQTPTRQKVNHELNELDARYLLNSLARIRNASAMDP